MGWVQHNAIVITSWDEKRIAAARQKATELGMQVLGPVMSAINCFHTLVICPDGSKEGWPESDAGDRQREQFKEWLDTLRYDDGSTALEWVEVQYGSDSRDAEIVAHAWDEDEPDEAESLAG
jgi:hypothetical protein